MSSDRPDISTGSVAIASAWAILSRWSIRLLGLVSTVILARILSPEDFGIVAMAMIVVGFSEVVLEFGVNSVLIHRNELTRDDYNTAWTLNIIQGITAAAAIVLLAEPAAGYFGDERLIPILYVLSFGMLIGSFYNIGVVDFQRNLKMRQDFMFFVTQKLSGVVVAITVAVILKSYWAMVYAYVAVRTIRVLVSYVMHEYRPRLGLKKIKEFWRMSVWLIVSHMGRFAQEKLDRFIVGGTFNASTTGLYTVASELAQMLISELLAPVARALLPSFAAMQDDPKRLNRAVEKALAGVFIVAIPATFGMIVIARDFILVVLGDKWEAAVPLLQVLSFVMVMMAVRHTLATLLTAVGRVSITAWGVWLQIGMFVVIWLWLFQPLEEIGVAYSRSVAAFIYTVLTIGYTIGQGLIGFRQFLSIAIRPFIAATIMGLFVFYTARFWHDVGLLSLLSKVLGGALVYTLSIWVLWILFGRPASIERMALDGIMSVAKRGD